jgi:hypothetical protein
MSRTLRPSPICLNCGVAVATRFCPECGQENTTYRVSLGRLVGDLFEEVFQLESRLWRTLWALFRRPGLLTREYNAGRRVAYTTPLRLYLLTSVVYFFAIAVVPPANVVQVRQDLKQEHVDVEHLAPANNWIDKRVRARLGITDKLDPAEVTRRGREIFVANVPRVLAVLVPFFALLLMLFFRGRFYVEHLVFSLHMHAFFFAAGTLIELLRLRIVGVVAPLATVVWALVALRSVYQQSWARIAWKAPLLAMIYGVVVGVGVLAAFLVGAGF